MLEVDYIIKSKKWNCFLENIDVIDYISNIFDNVVKVLNYNISKSKTVEISVTFTHDGDIKRINNEFRKCDKATNVLSFPLYEKEFLNVIKVENYVSLGDIVLSFETINIESIQQNKTFKNHLTHLIVHSILHLFGYDHIKDKDATEMEKLEINVLKNMGIDNPYLL
ncbi:MAG: rRNA maturation RNase YbeY [Rickettsiales bacterium]|nr:rRNA maturation RNase YbeY [Rickettsiales bacterium]